MISPKEVALVTGGSLRAAQRMLVKFRKELNKKDGITLEEFCSLGRYDETQVRKALEEAREKNPGLNKPEDE